MYAKIFKSGNSQAVRLPKDFRFEGTEVQIYKEGNKVILQPVEKSLQSAFNCLTQFPDDFMQDDRDQGPPQDRDAF